jgi:hypothetical protein
MLLLLVSMSIGVDDAFIAHASATTPISITAATASFLSATPLVDWLFHCIAFLLV